MFTSVKQAKQIADQQRSIFRQARATGDRHTMDAASKRHAEAVKFLRENGWNE